MEAETVEPVMGGPAATGAMPAAANAVPAPMATPAQQATGSTAAPSPATATETAATPAQPKITFPVRPAIAAHAGAPAPVHAATSDAGSIGGAVFSLLLVIGLILGLGWLARRMPGMQRGGGNAQLKVVASIALGPRDRAMVVDVGGTQLLLGVGTGGIRTLHTLEHPLAVAESPGASPFAQVLAQHFGRKP